MLSTALERLSALSLTVQQLGRLPRLQACLSSFLPSPRATVQASDVPLLFREPYILTGYRPAGQEWRCYLASLFQKHNELLNVWTHLLAMPLVLLCCWGAELDQWAGPLLLYVLSALVYLSFSTAAHLLQSHSEMAHYSLFFLDYVGVAVYQYGCSLVHYFYCAEANWHSSPLACAFLPGAALLAWLSCTGCCFAKMRYRRPYPPHRKLLQLLPTGAAYLLDISPVAHRLLTGSWGRDPALPFHALQVFFFLLAAFFFSYPLPESLFPGCCDVLGQAHQVFHVFLALCTLCQLEAVLRDFSAGRRAVEHGDASVALACVAFPALVLCCLLTAALMLRSVQKKLSEKKE